MATSGESRQRNGEIESFRFVLAIVVLLYHMGYFLGWNGRLTVVPRGYLAVEAFYVLSGYFLWQSLSKGNTHLLSYMGRRVKSFYPELLVSLCVAYCFRSVFNVPDCGNLQLFFSSFVKEPLLLKMTGILPPIREGVVNGPTWYLSSMMLATIPLYLYCKFRQPDNLLMVLSTVVFAVLLHMVRDSVATPRIALHGVYVGNIRALSAMGIGMCAFPVAAWLGKHAFTHAQCLALTLVKHILLLLIVGYMLTRLPNVQLHLLWLLAVWTWLALAMSGQCLDPKAFANDIFRKMGKISLPLFLSHGFYAVTWSALMPTAMPNWLKIAFYLTASATTTATVMLASSLIRKHVPLFKKS